MRNIILIIILLSSGTAYSQIRAFDNSKAILPWIYNPTASFPDHLQAYAAYDGRGNSDFTPQSVVAGIRMPLPGSRASWRRGPKEVIGVQVLNTSQSLIRDLTMNLSFAQQIMLNKTVKFSFGIGGGIHSLSYDNNALIYMDSQDPLLNNGRNLFNFHLNAGVSLVVNDRFFVNLAAPYMLKDKGINIGEVIFRAGYALQVNKETKLIPTVNLDTYNGNMIYGGDLRLEYREMLSFIGGADRHKYYGGAMLDFTAFAFGYTYGLNYNKVLNNIQSHQISLIGTFSNLKLGRR